MNWFWTMWNGELSIKHCGCKWRSSLWIKPRQWKFNFGGKTSRNGWFSIAVQSFRTQFVHWAVSRVVAVSTPGHFFRKNMYECLPGQKGYPRSAKIVFVQGRRAISWRCVCQPSSRYNQLYFVVISSSRYRKWLIDVAVLNQFCLLEDFFTPRSSTNYASEISGRLVDTSQMSRTTSPSEYMVGQFFWVILQLIYLIKWRHPGSGSNYKGDIWTIQGSKPIFFLAPSAGAAPAPGTAPVTMPEASVEWGNPEQPWEVSTTTMVMVSWRKSRWTKNIIYKIGIANSNHFF